MISLLKDNYIDSDEFLEDNYMDNGASAKGYLHW